MSNTIRIKRRISGNPGAPSTLASAELAFNEVDATLYYGFGDNGSGNAISVAAIAGTGAFVSLGGSQTVTGDKTFTSTLAATAVVPVSDNSSLVATTGWVTSKIGSQTVGVTSFNTRAGAVVLLASDITPITDPLYYSKTGGTVSGDVVVSGNLTVNGVTTYVNSQTLDVTDKNITLAYSLTPTDSAANGGGITLLGTTVKSFNWYSLTTAWTSSENIAVATGKSYLVGATEVLNGTTLGATILSSSLQTVGTLVGGTWNATTIAASYGGTGSTGITGIVKGNGASAMTAAIAGTDYLSPSSTIDGGTF